MKPASLRRPVSGVLNGSGRVLLALSGFPLSVPGTLLAAVALGVLAGSLRSGNPYGYTLAGALLASLSALCLGGILQARRCRDARVQWDSGGSVRAGPRPACQRIIVWGVRLLPFYRLHFSIAGPMKVGRGASLYVTGEASSRSAGDASPADREELTVPLSLPFCGELRARGRCRIRDVFGLTGARLGGDLERNLLVQPALFSSGPARRPEALGGFEEHAKWRASEEERYYMREYLPGDRFRDINWKASSRLARLITRVSPYTQEKTRLLLVELRHFRDNLPETVESLVHLNVLKSWLLFFLREAKRDNPHFHFLVGTGRGAFRLETREDIDRFSLELSRLFFQEETAVTAPDLQDLPEAVPDPHTGLRPEERDGRVFIFTSPYDRGVRSRLARDRAAQARIYTTTDGGSRRRQPEDQGATVHLFPSAGRMPLPGAWVLRRDRDLHRPAGNTDVTVEYPLDIRLW